MATSRFNVLRETGDALASRLQDNIAGVLTPVARAVMATPIMGAPPPPWVAANLLNAWVNINPTNSLYPPAAYHRDALGYVHLRGYIVNGTLNATVLTLPAAYRPAYRMTFVAASFGGAGFSVIEVRADGDVFCTEPVGTTNLVLDSVYFLAEQ